MCARNTLHELPWQKSVTRNTLGCCDTDSCTGDSPRHGCSGEWVVREHAPRRPVQLLTRIIILFSQSLSPFPATPLLSSLIKAKNAKKRERNSLWQDLFKHWSSRHSSPRCAELSWVLVTEMKHGVWFNFHAFWTVWQLGWHVIRWESNSCLGRNACLWDEDDPVVKAEVLFSHCSLRVWEDVNTLNTSARPPEPFLWARPSHSGVLSLFS